MGQRRYQLMDGLRGIAAVSVVIFHSPALFGPLLPGGYLAVDFFFMLSGFVLHHAYGSVMDAGCRPNEFMLKRVKRLYPVYGLGVVLAVCAAVATGTLSIGIIAAATVGVTGLPFPPVAFGLTLYPINGPAWSLLYELLANFVMVLTWKHLTTSRLAIACATGALCVILSASAYGSMNHGLRWNEAPVALSRILFGFSCGLLIYRLKDKIRTPSWVVLTLPFFLVGIFATHVQSRQFFDPLFICLALPGILFLTSATHTSFLSKTCSVLGCASYPLYMVHKSALRVAEHYISKPLNAAATIAMVLALVIIGYVIDIWFDRPIQNFLKKIQLPKFSFGQR